MARILLRCASLCYPDAVPERLAPRSMDVALLVFLILLNGLFAMSEMALSASRKARLQVMLEAGERGAQAAIDLHDNPTKFLSTVQIGITSISVLNGIVGEAAFSGPVSAWLSEQFHLGEKASDITATALVVMVITMLSIVFGELVPKRVGQMFPETVARTMAPPMQWLSAATRPLVALLSVSTEAMLRLLGIRGNASRSVTEEEIAASLEEGLDAGVIEAQEHQMVRNVFRLDDRQIGSMMIPRAEISWIDAVAPIEEVLRIVTEAQHSRYPVCRGGLDDVIGVVAAHSLVKPLAEGTLGALADHLSPPVYVPETITGEFGDPTDEDAWAVQRPDGSWLVDGLIPVPELKDRLDIKELPEEDRGRYNTLAGMVMLLLGRLPRTTDVVEWSGWRFEVVDLDGKRVDKVLSSRLHDDN